MWVVSYCFVDQQEFHLKLNTCYEIDFSYFILFLKAGIKMLSLAFSMQMIERKLQIPNLVPHTYNSVGVITGGTASM